MRNECGLKPLGRGGDTDCMSEISVQSSDSPYGDGFDAYMSRYLESSGKSISEVDSEEFDSVCDAYLKKEKERLKTVHNDIYGRGKRQEG